MTDSAKLATYYELLNALRDAPGCPFCHAESDSVKRYVGSVLYEGVTDPGVRAELLRSGGYCHRHAHHLPHLGGGLGIAILYRDQVTQFLRLLDSLPAATRARARSPRRRPDDCPACRVQAECRERCGSTLIRWLHDVEMRGAFEAAHPICVPHFLALLRLPMDPEVRSYLVETQQVWMTALLRELEEFCRKHDYRFSHEGFGGESDSWLRAISAMVGEHDVL